ncbi:MAG: thymidine phosphorylase [Oscillospiraceae bacterium]|nr:thymidine phosphorylase [Oscillospiraceae bacterium]
MSILDLIQKKRRGLRLTDGEIGGFVAGVTGGAVPDYQTAALLMAICFAGLDQDETLSLTLYMARSGRTLDLSGLPGVKGDKHSTGGVGDKTTLVVAPLAAACGLTVAKLAGRGLGHTGGTVDKLESIPGFTAALPAEEFINVLRKTGVCVASQSAELAPADRVLYELRDVTGTVESVPLIAASVMSKKLAAGADCILLDVKCGDGAFMKTRADAEVLAGSMVLIGRGAGRSCAAVVTEMDTPLGRTVGNALEVAEAAEVLGGRGPEDLRECCLLLTEKLLELAAERDPGAFPADGAARRALAERKLDDGQAYQKLLDMVSAQGGDTSVLIKGFPEAPYRLEILSDRSGEVTRVGAEAAGRAAGLLGAGRRRKGDPIDHAAGLALAKKPGDAVRAGERLCELRASDTSLFPAAERLLREQIEIR